MAHSILVTYATQYGSTQDVAEAIAVILQNRALDIDIRSMACVDGLDSYAAVVMGAPLYVGKWHKAAHEFLSEYRPALIKRPVAVFALGPISPDPLEMKASRKQLEKDLAAYAWLKPVAREMFIGKFEPTKLNLAHRVLMALPASPLEGKPTSDCRNWDAIQVWARSLPEKLVGERTAR